MVTSKAIVANLLVVSAYLRHVSIESWPLWSKTTRKVGFVVFTGFYAFWQLTHI